MKNTNQMLMATAFLITFTLASCEETPINPQVNDTTEIKYTMPPEEAAHEGTWLQWPHNYGWDSQHKQRYESIWIAMAKALHTGEKVHIIVYDENEKNDVTNTLTNEGLDMSQVDFLVARTDDVWVRDNGPIFVKDNDDNLTILNWQFNGWGQKSDYLYDNQIPTKVSQNTGLPQTNVNMVLEGGAVEIDGNGTLMAKRSCIINDNRNPGLTQDDIENYFRVNLGVTNFIWMDGVKGEDITDDHIDFAARFVNENTIIYTHPDLLNAGELAILQNARNKDGDAYTLVELPITQENQAGVNIPGVYTNFYVGNTVVLVPNYNSSTDATANNIIQSLYPNKTVVGIDVRELYKDGGAIHCVTQQQPE